MAPGLTLLTLLRTGWKAAPHGMTRCVCMNVHLETSTPAVGEAAWMHGGAVPSTVCRELVRPGPRDDEVKTECAEKAI